MQKQSTPKNERTNRFTRRQVIKAGATMVAAAPLAALPFPAGIEPAPVAADTTKTEMNADDLAWMAKRVTRNEFGQRVIGTEDRTPKHWSLRETAFHIVPESRSYYPVYEFLRRSDAQRDSWHADDAVRHRMAWVWSIPEPLRAGFLAMADDVASTAHGRISSAMSDVLYSDLCNTYVNDCDDDEDIDWTDEMKLDSFSQPTTVGAVLLALSEAMKMDPREWLNAHDLTLLRQATPE